MFSFNSHICYRNVFFVPFIYVDKKLVRLQISGAEDFGSWLNTARNSGARMETGSLSEEKEKQLHD